MSPGFAERCSELLASTGPVSGRLGPGGADWDVDGRLEAGAVMEMAEDVHMILDHLMVTVMRGILRERFATQSS